MPILGAGLAGLGLGSLGLTPAESLRAALDPGAEPAHRHAVLAIRLPRFLLGVGAALAVSGTVLQAVLRNPLAEPGVIGLNGGAAPGASAALLPGPGAVGALPLAVSAVMGSTLAMALVPALAWDPRGASTSRLILVGIAVAALCGALLTALSLAGPPQRIGRLLVWLAGDLDGASPAAVASLRAALALLVPPGLLGTRALDLAR